METLIVYKMQHAKGQGGKKEGQEESPEVSMRTRPLLLRGER